MCGLGALRRPGVLKDVSYGHVEGTEGKSRYGVSERVSW